MIRFFEKQDKQDILCLASEYNGDTFEPDKFAGRFDDIISKTVPDIGIAVLHAGEYLGYCTAYLSEKELIIDELYIRPEYQKKKVAPQVFDFIEAEFPDCSYQALVPRENEIAYKVFSERGYTIIII